MPPDAPTAAGTALEARCHNTGAHRTTDSLTMVHRSRRPARGPRLLAGRSPESASVGRAVRLGLDRFRAVGRFRASHGTARAGGRSAVGGRGVRRWLCRQEAAQGRHRRAAVRRVLERFVRDRAARHQGDSTGAFGPRGRRAVSRLGRLASRQSRRPSRRAARSPRCAPRYSNSLCRRSASRRSTRPHALRLPRRSLDSPTARPARPLNGRVTLSMQQLRQATPTECLGTFASAAATSVSSGRYARPNMFGKPNCSQRGPSRPFAWIIHSLSMTLWTEGRSASTPIACIGCRHNRSCKWQGACPSSTRRGTRIVTREGGSAARRPPRRNALELRRCWMAYHTTVVGPWSKCRSKREQNAHQLQPDDREVRFPVVNAAAAAVGRVASESPRKPVDVDVEQADRDPGGRIGEAKTVE